MTARPWIGGLLSLAGAGIMSIAGSSALAYAVNAPTVSGVLTYTIELTAGIVVAASAFLALALPKEHRLSGYVIASFSLLSLFGVTGALCFGSMLGVFGSAALLVWFPAGPRTCPTCGAPMRMSSLRCEACGTWVPSPLRSGPAVAFAIALTALFFVHIATALAAIGPYPLRKFPPEELLPGILAEAALLIGGVMAYRRPKENRRWGAVLIAGSLLAIVGPYIGFILGPLFGFGSGLVTLRKRWE